MSLDPVDIDEIQVKVVILAKNVTALKSVAVFFRRRGWPAVIFGSLSKAVEYIQEHNPDFVLISFNHPHPSIQKVPELLNQKFAVDCIGFVEGTDAISVSSLTSAKVKHKIFGQPTGPNLYRGVRRILAEALEIKYVEAEEKQVEEKEDAAVHIFAGEKRSFKQLREEKRTGLPAGNPQQQQQTLMSRAFSQAFAGASKKETFHEVTKVGVFPVSSKLTPGYIVVTPPESSAQSEDQFLSSCQNVLSSALDTSQLPVQMDSGFWMDVPKMNFYDWAKKNGAFTLQQAHEGKNLGMSFLQSEKPLPTPRVSREKDMYSIPLDEIAPEVPVKFNLFLHFRHNKKFFLYLRPGRCLLKIQKSRLQQRNVKNIYVKLSDLKKLKQFFAEVSLKRTFTDKAA